MGIVEGKITENWQASLGFFVDWVLPVGFALVGFYMVYRLGTPKGTVRKRPAIPNKQELIVAIAEFENATYQYICKRGYMFSPKLGGPPVVFNGLTPEYDPAHAELRKQIVIAGILGQDHPVTKLVAAFPREGSLIMYSNQSEAVNSLRDYANQARQWIEQTNS